MRMIIAAMMFAAVALASTEAAATVVSDWNVAALAEVRNHKLGPPIVARALAIVHTCMFDAWAAYDKKAAGTVLGGALRRPASERTDANKTQAISFAAYRCLLNLFPAGASRLTAVMVSHGYDPADTSTDLETPTGIGNVAAAAVIEDRADDGANQYGDLHAGAYTDYTGYVPSNPPAPFCTPLIVCPPSTTIDPNHWQPLIGPPPTNALQVYIGPHWELVRPFALTSADQFDHLKIAPPPDVFKNAAHYLANVEEVIAASASLDLERKLIVEYWADGPASELPPGHWGIFGQFVSQRDNHTIDQDVKMFFAMHNASFDAGIVGWHIKRLYNSVRPITAIRYLKQGQTILAYGGPGRPTENIPGEQWMPYNPGSNLTPAFPSYISGHAMFSNASAEILKSFTGSDHMGFTTVIPPNFGRVEPGIPPVPTTMSFDTFTQAADAASISRLYGGIHFTDDMTVGNVLGRLVGQQTWDLAQTYFSGKAWKSVEVAIKRAHMEGDLRLTPSAQPDGKLWVSAGYVFAVRESRRVTTVSFTDAKVRLPVRCSANGAPLPSSKDIVITFEDDSFFVPPHDHRWLPVDDVTFKSPNRASTAGYQGAVEITTADVTSRCGPGAKTLFLNYNGSFGASFSSTVTATPGRYDLDIVFHYRAPAGKGAVDTNCSDATDPNAGSSHRDVCGGRWSQIAEIDRDHGRDRDKDHDRH